MKRDWTIHYITDPGDDSPDMEYIGDIHTHGVNYPPLNRNCLKWGLAKSKSG